VLGIPVATVNREEGPAYGAALLAAVGVGAFSDLRTAAAATASRGPVVAASAAAHAAYDAPYARFRGSYRA
jgi:xylulokinase